MMQLAVARTNAVAVPIASADHCASLEKAHWIRVVNGSCGLGEGASGMSVVMAGMTLAADDRKNVDLPFGVPRRTPLSQLGTRNAADAFFIQAKSARGHGCTVTGPATLPSSSL
jgi:hypothetical protein